MRLLHLLHTPRHSGAEMLVRDLCLRHRQQDVDCAVAAFAPSTPEFDCELDTLQSAGVACFVPRKVALGAGRIAEFAKAIRRFKPDVIFGHSALPSIYGRAALLASGSRARFVSVLHSGTDDYGNAKLRLAESVLQLRTDRIIAVAQSAADAFTSRIKRHAPIEIVLNGIDLDRFKCAAKRRDEIRASLGLAPHHKLILQVGRTGPVKQQLMTFEALAPLLREHQEARLWFAGIVEDAKYAAELQARIAGSPHGDRVRFLGPRRDVPDLLAAADVYVMPSRSEAHSIAFLEAMASGVPIVASRIESFAFADGWPGTTLVGVQDTTALREASRAFLKHPRVVRPRIFEFDLDNTVRQYAELAQELSK